MPAEAAGWPGTAAQREPERAARGGLAAATELQLAEQCVRVGREGPGGAGGGDGAGHRGGRAAEVAVQLAKVGDARVAAQVGVPADHALERALRGVVAAELDERVDEHGERRR